jgi:hypothetical protein
MDNIILNPGDDVQTTLSNHSVVYLNGGSYSISECLILKGDTKLIGNGMISFVSKK